ncbi:MAG TPA: hypothetical protein VMS17_05030 [Gemmataceae bacterium]|nr:hypothetical protein [Gemmataceae bacterium]
MAERLAGELRNSREGGQPLIYETEYPSGRIRVIVIWDTWDAAAPEDRTSAILRAYDLAEGRESRDKIALASGLTVPEACAAGMLPYQILAALRKGDPLTREQAHQAMLEEGASTLMSPDALQLRFPAEEDAKACVRRLIQRFPGTEDVWLINRDATAQDFAAARDEAGEL